ncbi:MAG: hypothetical protein VKM97_00460 [Cyanobacteriota bacterium]|nr:hypothetical protein [Cyanobacteriota bacterium]
MVFKRKDSFFLELGSQDARPAKVAIAKAEPATSAKAVKPEPATTTTTTATTAPVSGAKAAAAPVAPPVAAAPSATSTLTTAEAIAAELRAAQEARPAPSLSTFAPDALNPAKAVPMRRRRAGANLAVFKAMAQSMTGT